MEDRHIIEAVVTNAEGKKTAWIGLGEMKLEDVKVVEAGLLNLFLGLLK